MSKPLTGHDHHSQQAERAPAGWISVRAVAGAVVFLILLVVFYARGRWWAEKAEVVVDFPGGARLPAMNPIPIASSPVPAPTSLSGLPVERPPSPTANVQPSAGPQNASAQASVPTPPQPVAALIIQPLKVDQETSLLAHDWLKYQKAGRYVKEGPGWLSAGWLQPVPAADIVEFPYDRLTEYDLAAQFLRHAAEGRLELLLPVGEAEVSLVIDGRRDGRTVSGLTKVAGHSLSDPENTARYQRPLIETGQTYDLHCTVRRNAITASLNGMVFSHWEGNPSELGRDGDYSVARGRLGIVAADASWEWKQTKLVPRKLRPKPPPAKAAAPFDLIQKYKPSPTQVSGQFTPKADGWEIYTKGGPSSVVFPDQFPPSYRLEVSITKVEGAEAFIITLPVGHKHALAMVNAHTTYGALGGIEVKGPLSADKTYCVENVKLAVGRVYKLTCDVTRDSVLFMLDGKKLAEWKGDANDLDPSRFWRNCEPGQLILSSWDTRYRIASVVVTPRADTSD